MLIRIIFLIFLNTQKNVIAVIAKFPSLEDYSMCKCCDLGDGTIGLDCCGAKLGDKTTSKLLKLFIYGHNYSPLGSLNFVYNHLTRIPKELAQLKQLKSVNFKGNTIKSIKTNDLPQNKDDAKLKVNNLADNSLIKVRIKVIETH